MFSLEERTQLQAALILWQEIASTSRVHPSEIPSCKTVFVLTDTLPLSGLKFKALVEALDHADTHMSVPVAAALYKVPKHRIRRELRRMEAFPVPGTRIYPKSTLIHAVARIRNRDTR